MTMKIESDSLPKEEAEMEPPFPSYLCEEAPNENNHHQAATFVIMRSGGV